MVVRAAHETPDADGVGSMGSDLFPWIVALVSLILVLALFFSGTVQGITEQEELLEQEKQLQDQLDALGREDRDLIRRTKQIETNPETLLHEMQRQGMPTPSRSGSAASDRGRSGQRQSTPRQAESQR